MIHAGCGARTGCIRVMLFWTAERKGEKPYNSDSQHTVLSLLVQLCVLIWDKISTDENQFELIRLIFFAYSQSSAAYRKTCCTTFKGAISELIYDFNDIEQRSVDDQINKLQGYASKLDLFAQPEYRTQPERAAKKENSISLIINSSNNNSSSIIIEYELVVECFDSIN